jgi:hypothetical protein
MKKFNEWQDNPTLNESPEILIEKIAELAHAMEMNLKTFTGERFEGFLSIVGTLNNLKRALVEVQTGTVSDKMMPTSESTEPKKKVKSSKKQTDVNYKYDKSSGVRSMDSDLSKDYKKYAKKLGTVDPFKVVKNETTAAVKLNKAYEAHMSSISNDEINRVDDKPIGDLTKKVYCRIMDRNSDEDIGFVSLPPDKFEILSSYAAKSSGLSLSSLQRNSTCHMTKFGLRERTQVYLSPITKDKAPDLRKY